MSLSKDFPHEVTTPKLGLKIYVNDHFLEMMKKNQNTVYSVSLLTPSTLNLLLFFILSYKKVFSLRHFSYINIVLGQAREVCTLAGVSRM